MNAPAKYGFEEAASYIMEAAGGCAADAGAPGIFVGAHGEALEHLVRRYLARHDNYMMNDARGTA
jgi:hypothetical protein